jgi:hypothetical protein
MVFRKSAVLSGLVSADESRGESVIGANPIRYSDAR